MADIFVASQVEVREMLTNVLVNSAKSIPLLLPSDPPELCLWQFRNVVKTWQERSGGEVKFMEERIFNFQSPIVSFISLNNDQPNKELAINKAFYDQNYQVFRDFRSTYEQQRQEHEGLIDMAWVGPKDEVENDGAHELQTLMTVFNVHGGFLNNEHQQPQEESKETKIIKNEQVFQFVFRYSQKIVIFASDDEEVHNLLLKHAITQESTTIKKKLMTLHFIVLSNQANEKLRNEITGTFGSTVTFIDNNKTIDDYYLLLLRNAVFKRCACIQPSAQCENKTCGKQFNVLLRTLNEIGEDIKKKQQKVKIKVDSHSEELKGPIDAAGRIFTDLMANKGGKTLGQHKTTLLKLQDPENSQEYVTFTKNKNRNKKTFKTKTVIEKDSHGAEVKKQIPVLDRGKPRLIDWAKESNDKLEELGKLIVKTYIQTIEKDREGNEVLRLLKKDREEDRKGLVMSVLWQLETYMDEANAFEAEWKNETNNVHQRRQAKQEMKKKRRCSALFLDILAQKLDQQSFEEMTKLRNEHKEIAFQVREAQKVVNIGNNPQEQIEQIENKGAKLQSLKEKENALSNRINIESFGLEHIFREFSLIWFFGETYTTREKNLIKEFKDMFGGLPMLCAEQLMNGTPIELMDGDTSFIYHEWITEVLDCVKDKMMQRYNASKGFITSIMGLQSSGKSTLLNTQYNLKFAVAAGRCTKGIFMLPVILSKSLRKQLDDKIHFMLLFDTEGLRAQELGLSEDTKSKDNEMATACIGVSDVTCINSMNFQNAELFEILSIVVNMMIRYKKDHTTDDTDSFDVGAIFINQGISETQYKAIDLGIAQRQKDLNLMTQNALKRQGVPEKKAENIPFTEIIENALDEQFIEPLFVDEGNIRRYSYDYVQKVHLLRLQAMKRMMDKSRDLISIAKKIETVYVAILKESHDFKYENDEALACDFVLQEQFQKMKAKMIDELDRQTKHVNANSQSELNTKIEEVVDKIKKEFDGWADSESKHNKRIRQNKTAYMEKLHNQFFTFKDENDKYAEAREKHLKFHKTLSELIYNKDYETIKAKFASYKEEGTMISIDFQKQYRAQFEEHFFNAAGFNKSSYIDAIEKHKDKFPEEIVQLWKGDAEAAKRKEEEEQKKTTGKKGINRANTTVASSADVFKFGQLEEELPAHMAFLVSRRKRKQEKEKEFEIRAQREEFKREVIEQIKETFKEIADQPYNSATFGKAMAKADRIIHNLTSDPEKEWAIVPADFFKPITVDRYMHALIRVFEKEAQLKARCVDKEVLVNEIIKPMLENQDIKNEMIQAKAEVLVKMLKLYIETKFREYIMNKKVERMVSLLNGLGINNQIEGMCVNQTKLALPKDKEEVFARFQKEVAKLQGEEAVNLMHLFLTDFNAYLEQDLLKKIKEHLAPKDKFDLVQALFQQMRRDFLNIWRHHFYKNVKNFFQANIQVYPGSSTEVDKKLDGYRKQMENDDATWLIVRAQLEEDLGKEDTCNLKSDRMALIATISDFEIHKIAADLQKSKYGCMDHCPMCGVICQNKTKDHEKETDKDCEESKEKGGAHISSAKWHDNQSKHYFPGFRGMKVRQVLWQSDRKTKELKPVGFKELLVNDVTCSEIRLNAGVADQKNQNAQAFDQLTDIISYDNKSFHVAKFIEDQKWNIPTASSNDVQTFFDDFVRKNRAAILKKFDAVGFTREV